MSWPTLEKKQEVIRRVSEGESRRSVAQSFNISHNKSWESINEDTIKNCFARCGFPPQ